MTLEVRTTAPVLVHTGTCGVEFGPLVMFVTSVARILIRIGELAFSGDGLFHVCIGRLL